MASPARGALYGVESLSWRVNSQSFVLLGGPRAAILQVCDPGVAAGVASYSTYRTDPFGRLERTLEAMLTISFGSPERRDKVLAGLEEAHRNVRGTTPDGAEYSALDRDRQFWVLATLTDTVIEVDRRYLGRLRPRDREAYYEESKRLAEAFGIPESCVPADYGAFRDYFAERVANLKPTADSRTIAETLVSPRLPVVPDFAWLPFNLVTRELMPTRLRHQLGMADLNVAELASVRAAQLSMRNSIGQLRMPFTANPLNARAVRAA